MQDKKLGTDPVKHGAVALPAAPPPPPLPPRAAVSSHTSEPPNFDGLALAVAQQNNLIAGLSLLIGLVAVIAGLGWGILVKLWAEKAAKEEAREWLEKNAGDLLAKMAPPVHFPGPDSGTSRPLTPEEQAEELETEGDQP